MSLNVDAERTKIIDHINAAISSSRDMRHDLLTYLLEMAMAEAQTAFDPPKVLLRRPGQPPRRIF